MDKRTVDYTSSQAARLQKFSVIRLSDTRASGVVTASDWQKKGFLPPRTFCVPLPFARAARAPAFLAFSGGTNEQRTQHNESGLSKKGTTMAMADYGRGRWRIKKFDESGGLQLERK